MVKKKANELFGEIDWDTIESGQVTQDIVHTERMYAFFMMLGILGVSLLIVFYNLFISGATTRNAYSTMYTWLNLCQSSCQNNVNVELLDRMTDCKALNNLYYEPHDNFGYEWRLAINDRAASLGCVDFPKEIEVIKAESAQIVEQVKEQKIIQNNANQQKLLTELNAKQARFTQSIVDGNLTQYMVDSYQDSKNQDKMILVMTNVWEQMLQRKRMQLSVTFWQKWVNINNPNKPNLSFIELRNASGAIIGGSNTGDSSNIWVRRD